MPHLPRRDLPAPAAEGAGRDVTPGWTAERCAQVAGDPVAQAVPSPA